MKTPDDPLPVDPLPVDAGSEPVPVPAFGCVIYISKVDGGVQGRVANLPDIQFTASSERAVYAKIVPEFKKRVSEYLQDQKEIPWIDPPLPIESNEQKRFMPVHL